MENAAPLTVKRPSYSVATSLDMDSTKPEPPAQLFAYVGTPSDDIGADGDFYLEEETNLLYGPKVNGTWPDEGEMISGPVIRRRKKGYQRAWCAKPATPSFSSRVRLFLGGLWETLRFGWRSAH